MRVRRGAPGRRRRAASVGYRADCRSGAAWKRPMAAARRSREAARPAKRSRSMSEWPTRFWRRPIAVPTPPPYGSSSALETPRRPRTTFNRSTTHDGTGPRHSRRAKRHSAITAHEDLLDQMQSPPMASRTPCDPRGEPSQHDPSRVEAARSRLRKEGGCDAEPSTCGQETPARAGVALTGFRPRWSS